MADAAFGVAKKIARIGRRKDPLKQLGTKLSKKKQKIISKI